jgi:putative oxidoreductase
MFASDPKPTFVRSNLWILVTLLPGQRTALLSFNFQNGETFMSMQKSGSPSSWLTCTDGFAAQWQDLLLLVARILFGWTFVMSGWRKLMDISGFVATMPNRGLPDFLGYIAPFVEFIGGVLVVIGLATRYASLLLLPFIIIAAFSSHRYWAAAPAQVANQSAHFWKAVTMMGGAVLLFITGAGRYALDAMLQRKP